MIGNELKESKDISLAEVLEILEKRKKRGPLGYEQQTSHDYCENFVKLSITDTKGLISQLLEIEEINEKTAIKIVDIMPMKEAQLKIILAKDRIELSSEKLQKVFEIIMNYKPKMEEYIKKKKKAQEVAEKKEKTETKEEKKKEKKVKEKKSDKK